MPKELTAEQRELRRASKERYRAKHRDEINVQRRQHRQDNKESINEQNREYRVGYREKNREHLNQKNKEWRDNNPEMYKAHQRRSMEKPENRETAKQRTKTFRQTEFGAEYIVTYDREYRAIPAKRIFVLCTGARRRAELNVLKYDDDLYEYLAQNIPIYCPCCSKVLDYSTGKGRGDRRNSPSLDRFDCELGYTKSNTEILCWRCNDLKRDSCVEEIEALATYMRTKQLTKSAAIL